MGLRTALVCKSLLGKAHTVMAEGGVAAALGNVYAEDNWKVHFRDTMRGGKMLNNWRMAQLHAQEAPDRVRELEDWGALFDRTKDGLILQRDFGGHRFARLAHIGDRTGLELIRTLQQKAVADGIEVFMEVKVLRLLHDADGVVSGVVGYWRPSGEFVVFTAKAVVMATGRRRARAGCTPPTRGSPPGDGHAMSLWAGADLIDMEAVQFHPTGMVWPLSVRGILVTEGVRGDGGVLRNSEGQPVHVRLHPTDVRGGDGRLGGRSRQVVRRPLGRSPAAGAPPPRRGGPVDQQRGQGRPGKPPRRRLPRHRHPPDGRGHPPPSPLHVPPVQGAGRGGHHRRGHGGGARPATTSWVGSGWTPTRRPPPWPGCLPPARWPVGCTAPTGSAATPFPTCWCSGGGPASAPPSSPPGRTGAVSVDEGQVEADHRGRRGSVRERGGREPLRRPSRPAGRPCRAWSGSSVPDPSSRRRWASSKSSRSGPSGCR